jgi:hypothetical protein
MPISERVNIATAAKDLRTNGYGEAQRFDPDLGNKPELFAVTSILIDDLVKDAYDSRNVTAMASKVTNRDFAFALIREMMEEELKTASFTTVAKLNSGGGSESLRSVFQRMQTLLREENPTISDEKYLDSGVGTATVVSANVLSLIPRVMEGKITHQRMLGVAQASYPLVLKLAAMRLDPFLFTAERMRDFSSSTVAFFRSFDPGFFELSKPQKEGQEERLDFNERGRDILSAVSDPKFVYPFQASPFLSQEVIDTHTRNVIEGRDPQIGCPGLVNFGEGSAIRTLWDWHVEIAREVYPMFYPSESQTEQVA